MSTDTPTPISNLTITDSQKPDLLIYHGGCPDGIGGAWAFWREDQPDFPNSGFSNNYNTMNYHGGRHGETPPDVTGMNVIFVDFSYPLEETLEMLKKAKSILILDHHKSSNRLKGINDPKFRMVLDMDRSGAQIAWDFMNPGIERPWFIDHIADRDLWRWLIPHSKATCRAMFAGDYYKNFDEFHKLTTASFSDIVTIGNVLLADDERSYANIISHAIDCMCVSLTDPSVTWKCRVVECEGSKKSEVGNRLVQDGLVDFSAMFSYVLELDEWWVSLRALPGSDVDLTQVIKHFGNGGGHPKASGFCIKGSDGHSLKTLFKPVNRDSRFHLTKSDDIMDQPGDIPGEPSQE